MTADPLALCADLVEQGIVDALQIAYRRDGVVTSAAFGACDESSRFALASLTKPLVAVACLVACEEGVLALDQPVRDVIPAAPCAGTLRDLLCHASGLPADSTVARRLQLDPGSTWETVGAMYAELPPECPPQIRRTYSNAGYAVAARMLERAAEMPMAEYLGAAVLAPLAMNATTLGAAVDDASVITVRQPGLLGHGQQLFNGARFRALGLPQSGGFGTAGDYLRLLDSVRGLGPEVLAAETRRELTINQGGSLPGGVGDFMEWEVCDWAVGFELRDAKVPHWTGSALSATSFTHFGAAGTLAFVDPDRGVEAVLLANRGTYSRWMLEPAAWPAICAALVA
jgi:CubicO group peptidase (beta-lactamase class C family)